MIPIEEIFEVAKEALSGVLSSNQSYQSAVKGIIVSLTGVAQRFEDPARPIHILVDIYPNDPQSGHLTPHPDGAWMVINFERTIVGDWGCAHTLPETISGVAWAFSLEMHHYQQCLAHWDDLSNNNR